MANSSYLAKMMLRFLEFLFGHSVYLFQSQKEVSLLEVPKAVLVFGPISVRVQSTNDPLLFYSPSKIGDIRVI